TGPRTSSSTSAMARATGTWTGTSLRRARPSSTSRPGSAGMPPARSPSTPSCPYPCTSTSTRRSSRPGSAWSRGSLGASDWSSIELGGAALRPSDPGRLRGNEFGSACPRLRLLLAHHLLGPDPLVELLGGHESQLGRGLLERLARAVRGLGDL